MKIVNKISNNSKNIIGNFNFLSIQHIPHLLCKDSHFWGKGERGGLHILNWETSWQSSTLVFVPALLYTNLPHQQINCATHILMNIFFHIYLYFIYTIYVSTYIFHNKQETLVPEPENYHWDNLTLLKTLACESLQTLSTFISQDFLPYLPCHIFTLHSMFRFFDVMQHVNMARNPCHVYMLHDIKNICWNKKHILYLLWFPCHVYVLRVLKKQHILY